MTHKQKNPLSINQRMTNLSFNYINDRSSVGDVRSLTALKSSDSCKIISLGGRDNDNLNGIHQQFYKKENKGKLVKLFQPKSETYNDFIDILSKKQKQNQLAFITVFGSKNSGKSLLCDTFINMGGEKGNHYFHAEESGVYAWSIPFKKNDLSIFLVQAKSQATQEFQMNIIRKLLRVSGIWVVMDEQKLQELQEIVRYIIKDQKYQNMTQPQKIFLPNHIYLASRKKNINFKSTIFPKPLYYYIPSATQQQQDKNNSLELLHQVPSLTLSSQYLQTCFSLLKSISNNIEQRVLSNKIHLNSNIFIKMQQIHANNENQEIMIEQKIIEDTIEQQYQKNKDLAYSFYRQQIKKYFCENGQQLEDLQQKAKPKEVLQLYNKLRRINQMAFIKFGALDPYFMDMAIRQKYYKQLEAAIEQQQSKYIQKNKRITLEELNKVFLGIKSQAKSKEEYIKALKSQKPQLNHGRQEFIKVQLESLFTNSNLPSLGLYTDDLDKSLKGSKLKLNLLEKNLELSEIKKLTTKIYECQKKIENFKQSSHKNNQVLRSEDIHQLKKSKIKQKIKLTQQLNKLSAEKRKEQNERNQEIEDFNVKVKQIKSLQKQVQVRIARIKSPERLINKKKSHKNFCGIKF